MELMTGFGLASAAGLNAYIPLLSMGVLGRFTHLVHLPPGWAWLQNGWVIGIVAILLVTRDRLEPSRLWVGGTVGLLSLSGLAGLTRGNPPINAPAAALRKSGGIVGALIGHSLSLAIGSIGAAIVLVALLFVAVVIATGITARIVAAMSAVGRSSQRRPQRMP